MSSLHMLFLGTPSVERDAVTLQFARRKALALLAYLALAGEPCRRDALAALLWPDHNEADAHAYLRNALWVLKNALGEEWVDVGRDVVGVPPRAGLSVDVTQFQVLLGSCAEHGHSPHEVCPACLAPLAQAVELYRDDFMTGFSLSDSQAFDEWQLLKTEGLRHELAMALQQLVRCMSAQQQFERAIPYARRWLALDPLNEEALRQMMRSYTWAGQSVAALKQYRAGARLLSEELGLQPAPETVALYRAIKANETLPLPALALGITLPPKLSSPKAARPGTVAEAGSLAPSRSNAFVDRTDALKKLELALHSALAGRGQVMFIKGETGTGKTALAREFARLAQEVDDELLVATGSCDHHTGPADPFLPFRDVLNLLAGDVESRGMEGALSAENATRLQVFAPIALPVLVDRGPDLVESMAGTVVQAQARMLARGGQSGSTGPEEPTQRAVNRPLTLPNQSRIFGEYANVVQHLARHRPLVLVLDDLQWADASSINLLSHLGRRIDQDPVLIIGAYRPEDVTLAVAELENPLQSLLGEFKRRFGAIEVDLDDPEPAEARRFVDALIDREPNQLGEAFRECLFEHTRGQPLFTIELLRHLQDSGTLKLDEAGRWAEACDPDWHSLPARIEGIIEKRIGRLTPELRRMLRLASVEGEEFTAEVLAELLGAGQREVIERLGDELDREHRLVSAQGLSRVNERRLSRYRFRQVPFQQYIYSHIGEAERAYLHEDVANALERLYGDHVSAVAGQLARHFEAAGNTAKAVDYLLLAGSRARQVTASQEAIAFLSRALALLESQPLTTERTQRELVALINLGSALIAVRGYADPEVGRVFGRAHALAAPLEAIPHLFSAVNGLLQFYRLRGDLQVACDLGEQLLVQAQLSGDPSQLAEAHRSCGITALYLGQPARAYEHFREGLHSFKDVDRSAHILAYGDDPWVSSLSYGALVLWLLGYPDQAAEQARTALAQAEAMASFSPFGQVQTLVLQAVLQIFRRDYSAAGQSADAAFDLAARHGFEFWYAASSILQGRVRARQGWHTWGTVQMERGLGAWRATGIDVSWHYGAALLAETYFEMGETAHGLHVVDDAVAASPRAGYWWLAELHRLRGELLLQAGAPLAEVENALRQSVVIASEQGARSLELRAATSLARLERERQTGHEAARCLGEIYSWFQGGLDTPDLQEAFALLVADSLDR